MNTAASAQMALMKNDNYNSRVRDKGTCNAALMSEYGKSLEKHSIQKLISKAGELEQIIGSSSVNPGDRKAMLAEFVGA